MLVCYCLADLMSEALLLLGLTKLEDGVVYCCKTLVLLNLLLEVEEFDCCGPLGFHTHLRPLQHSLISAI